MNRIGKTAAEFAAATVTVAALMMSIAGPARAQESQEAQVTLRPAGEAGAYSDGASGHGFEAGGREDGRPPVVMVPPPYFDPEAFQRMPPADRFTFRGEHAGIIYTPSGWRALGPEYFDPYYGGIHVTPPAPPVGLGASYEVVTPGRDRLPVGPPRAMEPGAATPGETGGRWEMKAEQVPIEGEYVEVYHPAVYQVDEEGELQLVEPEERTVEPKVKIVLRRVWVTGEGK